MQLSTISIPYGESMNQPPEQLGSAHLDEMLRAHSTSHLNRTSASQCPPEENKSLCCEIQGNVIFLTLGW
jgi:hypothetical protein